MFCKLMNMGTWLGGDNFLRYRNVCRDILGVSSGACVGAALAILLHVPKFFIMLMSFAFGVGTVAATVAIPKILKSNSNIMQFPTGSV